MPNSPSVHNDKSFRKHISLKDKSRSKKKKQQTKAKPTTRTRLDLSSSRV